MFQKGVSGNPGGRPKGAKAHIRRALPLMEAMGIEPLRKAIEAILKVEDPEIQAKLWLELARYIHPTTKVETVSKSPEDSVNNAQALLRELNANETGSVEVRVDNRQTPLQTEADTTKNQE
jgi:hypothetical protein